MPATSPNNSVQRRRRVDRLARRVVQIGFLLLFLYPLFLVITQRITFRAAPNLASWPLPWVPLLLTGHLARRDWAGLVIGAPLLLIALYADLRTVLLRMGLSRRHSARSGSAAGVLAETTQAVAGDVAFPGQCQQPSALLSVDRGGARRPFLAASARPARPAGDLPTRERRRSPVISRLQQPPLRIFLSMVSLVFVAILLLELWQPRFWCRNLCPLGALISLFSRFSLLNRRVSSACSFCGDRGRACVMNAIPLQRAARHRLLRLHLLPGMRERLSEHRDFVRIRDAGREAVAKNGA